MKFKWKLLHLSFFLLSNLLQRVFQSRLDILLLNQLAYVTRVYIAARGTHALLCILV